MEAIAKDAGPASYRDAFEERNAARRAEPAWLAERRAKAFERFVERGFPGPKDEAWRFTSTRRLTSTPWAPSTARPDPAHASLSKHALEVSRTMKIGGAFELVFVNGRLSSELSRGEMPDGVRISDVPLESWLGRVASETAFTDLNTAFFDRAVVVEVEPGAVVSNPIHLLFVGDEEEAFAFTSPRILFLAGAGSQSQLIETYTGSGFYWTNAVTEIVIRDGAIVEHMKRQEESASGFHLQSISVLQERSSRFTSHNVALGGALARTDLDVRFDGEGAECELNGLFVGSAAQHLDMHTRIDHAKPHCSSRELYKGILDGRSRGVFHGTILVRKDAQKTDAIQTNKNLLLSRDALVDSTPALEIFADDVKCKHGSTIGQLDQGALFYLRSRGIGEEDARAILTSAFAEDVARRIRVPEVRAGVEAALGLKLPVATTSSTSTTGAVEGASR